MKEYIFFMHNDSPLGENENWVPYIEMLQASGHFKGGSVIGGGACVRKQGVTPSISSHLSGFIRVEAQDLADAQGLLPGNPVFEAGGTVEIRELPRTG